MSGRIFQNIVLQFKETTDTVIGVIDSEGTVIACTDLPEIGQRWPHLVQPINEAEGACTALEGKTFKALEGWGGQFDFAAFTRGEDALSSTVCSMATVALNTAKSYYEEKHDKTSFVKSILSDNILLSDIYVRAKELHVEAELNRGVFVVRRTDEKADAIPVETVQNIFPDRQTSFVLSMGEDDVVLVQQLGDNVEMSDLEKTAAQIEETLRVNGESTVVVGIGTVATHLRDLAKSYKEAQMAIEVGKVFDTEKYIISYENLGIGRLIYQLPTTLCEMFLQEVFKKNPIDALDKETLFTINKFFENNLILSERRESCSSTEIRSSTVSRRSRSSRASTCASSTTPSPSRSRSWSKSTLPPAASKRKEKNLTRAVFGQPLFFRHFAAKKLKVYIITCCHRGLAAL